MLRMEAGSAGEALFERLHDPIVALARREYEARTAATERILERVVFWDPDSEAERHARDREILALVSPARPATPRQSPFSPEQAPGHFGNPGVCPTCAE